MGANVGKFPVGFCSACGKDVAVNKSDSMVRKHPNPRTGQNICYGSGKPPTFLYDEERRDFVQVEQVVVPAPPQERSGPPAIPILPELEADLVGITLPVYTEAGVVIGRARVDVGRITILGPKWAQRSA